MTRAETRLDRSAQLRQHEAMRIEALSIVGRRFSAAIFVAAAILALVFSSLGGAQPAGWSRVGVAQSGAAARACRVLDHVRHAPADEREACCGACALTTAPIPPASPDLAASARIPISTRIDFRRIHGRRLDGGPADVRSRAPPLAA